MRRVWPTEMHDLYSPHVSQRHALGRERPRQSRRNEGFIPAAGRCGGQEVLRTPQHGCQGSIFTARGLACVLHVASMLVVKQWA